MGDSDEEEEKKSKKEGEEKEKEEGGEEGEVAETEAESYKVKVGVRQGTIVLCLQRENYRMTFHNLLPSPLPHSSPAQVSYKML